MTIEEKILKHQLKIVSTLILLLAINVSFASETELKSKNPQEQEQAKQRGGTNDHAGQLEDQKSVETEEFRTSEPEAEDEEKEAVRDTLEDDSVSKYNFIFYFLYKFKYEAEA